jgi:hypothetical protein
MSGFHSVFCVTHLKKFVFDSVLVVESIVQKDIEDEPNVTVDRNSVRIVS